MLVMMPSAQCCCGDHAGCSEVNCCPRETVMSRKMMIQLECRYTGMPKMRPRRKPPVRSPERGRVVALEGAAAGVWRRRDLGRALGLALGVDFHGVFVGPRLSACCAAFDCA